MRYSLIIKGLQPELVITLGNSLISKNLKLFLRKNPPKVHWHIKETDRLNDTLKHLTRHIPASPTTVLNSLFEVELASTDSAYLDLWRKAEEETDNKQAQFLSNATFGEFKATSLLLEKIPSQS